MSTLRYVCVALLLVLSGCGSSGGARTDPPSGLSYFGTSSNMTVGVAVTLSPTLKGGTAGSWTVTPALPAGVTLDGTTGVISGTPTTVTAVANYTITASNANGSTSSLIPIQVVQSPIPSAQAANLMAGYDPLNGVVTLSWTNTFPSSWLPSFQVQELQGSGGWTTLAAPTSPTWSGTLSGSGSYRVEVMLDLTGNSVVLDTAAQQQQVTVTPPSTAPSLVVGGTQPITVNTPVSIAGGSGYAHVDYYLDASSVGSSTQSPSYQVTLNPNLPTTGSHQLTAQLFESPDYYLLLGETIQTTREIDWNITFDAGIQGTGTVTAFVGASSAFGIASVSASLDGSSLGTLTAPNCGSPLTPSLAPPVDYCFTINALASGSGTHTFSSTIDDGNGLSLVVTQQLVIDNGPAITLSVADGAIVFGSLNFTGSSVSDKTGVTVTTTASLNGVQILNTTQQNFSVSYDVSSLTPGSYSLVVDSQDNSNPVARSTFAATITVTSSSSLVYTPIQGVGSSTLLAEDGTSYLYTAVDKSIHLVGTSGDITLSGASGLAPTSDWHISGGNAYVSGVMGAGSPSSVFQWSPTGTAVDISANAIGTTDLLQAAHDGWAVWSQGGTGFEFYNPSSAQTINVTALAGALLVPNVGEFYLSGGQLTFFDLFQSLTGPSTQISRWDQSTGLWTLVAPSGQLLHTDGVFVAWQSYSCNSAGDCSLTVESVNGGTPQVLSAALIGSNFDVGGGLVAWRQDLAAGNSGGLMVYDGSTTTIVTDRLTAKLLGVSGGYVLYIDNSTLYAWSPAKGSQIILDSTPNWAAISGKTVYFTLGSVQNAGGVQYSGTQSLYQVTLN